MSETAYERFDDRAGFQGAVDRLLGQAGRELRAFDPDGAGLMLNDAARIGRIEQARACLARAMGCEESWIGLATQDDGFDWRSL